MASLAFLEKVSTPKFLDDRMKVELVYDRRSLVHHNVAPQGKSNLSPHDSREWLFDTKTPGYADAAVFAILNWLRSPAFRGLDAVFDEVKFSSVVKVLASTNVGVPRGLNTHNIIEAKAGDEAGKAIAATTFEPYEAAGFDEIMASWLGLARGDVVSIAPSQNYNAKDCSTVGSLVSLNCEEYCIKIQGNLGTFRCHFPIIGFTARNVEQPDKSFGTRDVYHLLVTFL
ncbi:glutathione s-transferase [Moniliophthora roreri MCA 2997]|uniref:Glutathione s-transferase n=1 Tax=Moniliophthora roreri (strain MCA 2997) TaxID=1381753 RepID=V2XHB8_MONRO|nr:glutathione s-transferase [Moniliophthora roreri MCA 2997]